MDDPWGSPWAEESSDPLPKISIATSKKPVAPKDEPRLSEDPKSPWDDDDNTTFGEWAALPAVEKTTSTEESGAGSGFPQTWTSHDTPALGSDDFANFTASEEIKLKPEALEIEDVINKRPLVENDTLDDPWAVEADGDLTKSDKLDEVLEEPSDGPEAVDEAQLPNDSAVSKSVDEPLYESFQAAPSESTAEIVIADAGVDASPSSSDQIHIKVDEQESLSSSRSERSHDGQPDSTRTSFEEERPQLKRSGSSKVKQLVEHFDGLSVEKAVPLEIASSGTPKLTLSRQVSREPSQYGEDDFGDFEEFEEGKISSGISRDPSVVGIDKVTEKETARQNEGSVADAGDAPKTAVSDPQAHGPITFDIDLTLVGKLFPSEIEEVTSTSDLSDIENFEDTFTSVEQRKTWYRISRYGTMRKYNSGDDENYVRINWANSNVRERTLEIVSRWMQEDRIHGGVLFGSSRKAGGIFGWDTQTSEHSDSKRRDTKGSISLESPVHSHGTVLGHDRRRSTLEGKFGSRRSTEIGSADAPHFSWSTSQSDTQQSGADIHFEGSSSPPQATGAFNSTSTFQNASSLPNIRNSQVPSLPEPVSKTATAAAPSSIQTNGQKSIDQDEGDEWGEMVSSPTAMTTPAFNEPILGHRSTKSLMGILTPQLSGSDFPPRPGHKSNFSESSPTYNSLTPVSPPSVFKEAQSATSNSDPWATADFSFFDSPAAPTQFSSAVPVAQIQPKLQPQVSPVQSSKDKAEEQRLVDEILRNLPDLSYMLRR